jgi:GH43 family beta-xylosidase
VLISKPELDWERQYQNTNGWTPSYIIYVNEGPQPLKSPKGNLVHIVYSASGSWTPYYKLGLLTADADADLLDPASWSKHPEPVFSQAPENGMYSTGHNSFFVSPDGKEHYILYHARHTDSSREVRKPHAQRFDWDKKGYPVFGKPLPHSTPQPKPSGTPRSEK